MTIAEAAALLGPQSPITVSTLRNAIARGELAAIKLAGKIFLTKAALTRAMTPKFHPRTTAQTYSAGRGPDDLEQRMRASEAAALSAIEAIKRKAIADARNAKAARDAALDAVRERRKLLRVKQRKGPAHGGA